MFNTIIFDLDGTLADLYNVDGWLQYLENEDTKPYENANLMYDSEELREIFLQLLAKGYRLKVKTWLSKKGTKEYNQRVAKEKEKWLKKHDIYKYFDIVEYLDYGTSKFEKNALIVDDDNRVLETYTKNKQKTIDAKSDIIKPLKKLLTAIG